MSRYYPRDIRHKVEREAAANKAAKKTERETTKKQKKQAE